MSTETLPECAYPPCKKPFEPTRPDQKYCCRDHGKLNWAYENRGGKERAEVKPQRCECTPDCDVWFIPKSRNARYAPEHRKEAYRRNQLELKAEQYRERQGPGASINRVGHLGAIRGFGKRRHDCLNYDDCLEDAQGWNAFKCPAECKNYRPQPKANGWDMRAGEGFGTVLTAYTV